jgi:DoxX-like family
MFAVGAVVSVLLGVTLLASAAAKLTRATRVVDSLTGIGVPIGWFPWLAGAEIAGGIGLIVGLAVGPLGVAAAIGVVLYFIGAVIAHLRAKDYKGVSTPAVLLVVAIVALALRAGTL